MDVYRQRLWLVNQAKAGSEPQEKDRTALAVPVPGVPLGLGQVPGAVVRTEGFPDGAPILGQALQELEADGNPLIEAADQLSGQYGVFA